MSISIVRKRECRAVQLRGWLAFLSLALLLAIVASCVSDRGAGKLAAVTVDPLVEVSQEKLVPEDGPTAVGDGFGGSVAVAGDTAVVGAFGRADKGSQSGAAYVFVRSGATWSQQAKLLADDGGQKVTASAVPWLWRGTPPW
jgi:hypothetical protein